MLADGPNQTNIIHNYILAFSSTSKDFQLSKSSDLERKFSNSKLAWISRNHKNPDKCV